MVEIKTRKLTIKDLSRISRLHLLNDLIEENVLDYLRISEDGTYLVYLKNEFIDKDKRIGTRITSWVYKFSSKRYFTEAYYISRLRCCGDNESVKFVRIADYQRDDSHFVKLIV